MRHPIRHIKRAEKRIKELEARVDALEARPLAAFTRDEPGGSAYPAGGVGPIPYPSLIPPPPVVTAPPLGTSGIDYSVTEPGTNTSITTVTGGASQAAQFFSRDLGRGPDDPPGTAGVPAKV